MTDNKGKQNRLANEQSPYLLQHAYNPVDWHPWSDEAFEKAKKEDKPIFLSIGYSTCHWCHVMETESFEDNEVAELMNETFISIKVDREERPDIDHIYMTVCQMMTGGGGWPLSVVMTPDKKPFFSGTYFPKENRHGRIGFKTLIKRIDDAWKNNREEVLKNSEEITGYLTETKQIEGQVEIPAAIFKQTIEQFKTKYDKQYGGFGHAPKFPSAHNLVFFLNYYYRTRDKEALEVVENTLTNMRKGGIFDHIGYGFHRYSTDNKWLLPHFEKMLYDQAIIALAYTDLYQITKNESYKDTAQKIFEYVLRDITSPDGAFYSAEDADSEGVEGKFYLWSEKELQNILGEENAELTYKIFNTTANGNFDDEATQERSGENILFLQKSYEELSTELNIPADTLLKKIEDIRKKLFDVREKRVHPYKDDKILTDWNGLMIAALAKAGRVFNDDNLIKSAKNAADFLIKNMITAKGGLIHRCRNGVKGLQANIDDYAFFVWALLELYESTFELDYLKKAIELNNYLIKNFWDDKEGGFFFTPTNGEKLIARTKELYDGAIPSGNSVSLMNIVRLTRITFNSKLEEYSEKLITYFSPIVNNMPYIFAYFLTAFDFIQGGSFEIIIAGGKNDKTTKEMLSLLNNNYLPNKTILLKDNDEIDKIFPPLKSYAKVNDKTTAYVCKNFACEMPVNTVEDLSKLLSLK